MDLSTPQQLSHVKSSTSSQNPSSSSQHKKHKNMAVNKLKEAIFIISNNEPNMPLSKTQNSILEQHLNQLLSNLTNSTPDHPPYAWMIQRALEELNEEGGSSEDSISKFITKEYENLPWAHNTLLKHHLQKLSENGEILRTDGGHFLLAGGDKSLNPKRKSKRKHMKRKRGWDWDIKQKKRMQKEKKEKQCVVQDVEVVNKQKKLDAQQSGMCENYKELNGHHNNQSTDKDGQVNARQNHITGDRVLCRGDQRIRVYEQKGKQQSDATEGPLRSSVASESHVGRNAGFVPIEPLRDIVTEAIEHSEDLELQHQKLSLSGVEETADVCNLYSQETLENEQPGDNLPQILSPEAPPGFEFISVEDAKSNKADNSASIGLDSPKEDRVVHQSSERPAADQAPTMADGSDALKWSKESLKQQGKEQLQGGRHTDDGVTPSAPVVSSNQNEDRSLDTERLEKEFVAEDLLKTEKQKKKHHDLQQLKRPTRSSSRVQREGTVTPDAPLLSALQCQQQEQHISDRDRRQKQLVLESSSEAKQQSIPRRMTRNQLKGIIAQPASSTASFGLKRQKRESSPEPKQQMGRRCGQCKKDLLNKMSRPDHIHGNLEKRETQQLTELLKIEGSRDIARLAVVEPSSEKQQQLTEPSMNEESQDIARLAVVEPSSEKQQQLTEPSMMERTQDIQFAIIEPSSEKQKLAELSKMQGSQDIELAGVEPSLEKQQAELSKMEGSQDIELDVIEPSSKKQQQLAELPKMEGSQHIELPVAESSSEKQQQLAELSKMEGSQVIELAVLESSSEKQQQLAELSKMEGSQDIELAVAEPSLEKQQQLTELSKVEGSPNIELSVIEPSSEKQQQLAKMSEMEGSQDIDLAVAEPSLAKHQQLTELSKMEGSQNIELAVIEPSSEKQQQLVELSKMEVSQDIELAAVEPSSEKLLEVWRSTPEKLNEDGEPFILLLRRPSKIEAAILEKSPQTDRAQRQLKRWGRNQCEPKPDTSTASELETSEQELSLIGPQHEVHLELPKHQLRGRSSENKEDGAKQCTSTMSALATNEVLSLDDPDLEVQLKQLKHKRLGRPPKRKDGGKADSTSLKNLGVSKKLKKNQNGQGRGRSRRGQ